MEQTTFNFGVDESIKELQKHYVKMFIKKINFELTQKNSYLNILPHFYNKCFVYEDWEVKRDITPDEILDKLIEVCKKWCFLSESEVIVHDKFVYKYILNEDFKKIFIKNLDKINYQLEDENFRFWHGWSDTISKHYLRIMCDYFLKECE